ncbi:TetR/AcrR family transcriptional regulator [Leifsonia sp. LS-T14]|uniref:TetR/AcrR family transcriptional regulator n=1 Tax=unclassified Leifsonia TaxID=2663824 RepID=UPI0035A5F9C3
MDQGPKRRMVEGAARLLAERGLQETSFSEVLALTGAPRGSIYYHFPEGKSQLVSQALEFAAEGVLERLEALRGLPADEVAAAFFGMWRQLLVQGGFRIGCSAAAVTVATDSSDLLASAATVFRAWTGLLADLLVAGGVPEEAGSATATLLLSATEGAVILSRAQEDIEPFDLAARALESYVRGLIRGSRGLRDGSLASGHLRGEAAGE